MVVLAVEAGRVADRFVVGGFFRQGEPFSEEEQEFMKKLIRELRRKPDPPKSQSDVSEHNWYGLDEITDGEMLYGLSPIGRLAFMMTQTDFKKSSHDILLDSGSDRELKVLLGEMARNIAAELVLNGGGQEGHNLTERQCYLLRILIGIGEDGKQQPPKTIFEFQASGKDGMARLVETEIAPMMRFIRKEFGGEIIDYFDKVRQEQGILVSM